MPCYYQYQYQSLINLRFWEEFLFMIYGNIGWMPECKHIDDFTKEVDTFYDCDIIMVPKIFFSISTIHSDPI